MFVNRTSELALLEKYYASNKAELFVLYGRRRVGKTELLINFCSDKPNVFFVADQSHEQIQRANFSQVINDTLFGPDLGRSIFPTWDDLFTTLARQTQSKRLIVVIDEFPYLVAAYPPLPSILQRIWDLTLKNSQIMLVLNGSYIGMMEKTVLDYRAPLYGRRTAQYLLEPLEFLDAQKFFLSYTPDDRLKTYAVYGGTPAYLRTIEPENSLELNIHSGILERGSFLYDEVRFILQQELREPRNYFAILQAIASGNTRQNEIKQATGLENIFPYLDTLQQLHLIERKVPVTESQPHKSRRGIYRLRDNFLRFWFRFVLPNYSQLERGAKELVYQAAILPELDRFTSVIFEQVCQQYFWRLGLRGQLPFTPRSIGSWWRPNEEIDLVALGDKEMMLVECKWSKKSVGTDILKDLEDRSRHVLQESGLQKGIFALCSRSGFTDQLRKLSAKRGDVYLYNWDEMVNFQ